jgi:hypothetical protein
MDLLTYLRSLLTVTFAGVIDSTLTIISWGVGGFWLVDTQPINGRLMSVTNMILFNIMVSPSLFFSILGSQQESYQYAHSLRCHENAIKYKDSGHLENVNANMRVRFFAGVKDLTISCWVGYLSIDTES